MGAGRPDLAGGAPAPEHPPRTWPVCYARRNHGRIRSIRVETTSTHTQNGPVGVEGASVEQPARVFAGGRPAEGPGTGAHRPVGPQRLDPAQSLRDPAVVAASTGDPEPHHVGGGSASETVAQCDLRGGADLPPRRRPAPAGVTTAIFPRSIRTCGRHQHRGAIRRTLPDRFPNGGREGRGGESGPGLLRRAQHGRRRRPER
jgi:hypothetical protein